MAPIEAYFITIALFITLIGLARGYARELGSTMIVLVAIFLLSLTESTMGDVLRNVSTRVIAAGAESVEVQNLFLSTLFELVFIAIIFAGYAGKTIVFGGTPARPPQGTIISLAIGLLNGYLIAGSLWYYQDRYDYPIRAFGLIQTNFSTTAQRMIELLPQTILPSPLYWMLPAALLLLLRVRG